MSGIREHCGLGSAEECVQGVWGPIPQGHSSVQMGNLEVIWVDQQSAVASSQSEEGGLLMLLQLVDGLTTAADIRPVLPRGAVSVLNDYTCSICGELHTQMKKVGVCGVRKG